MKHAYIVPTRYLDSFGVDSGIHLILSHLVNDPQEPINKYAKFFRDRSELKIMDNGLFENKVAEPINALIQKAKIVKADIIISPDVLYNGPATVSQFESMQQQLGGQAKLMAVPQGASIEEWIYCLRHLLQCGATHIGLSILSIPKSFRELTGSNDIYLNRKACLDMMEKISSIQKYPKTYFHALGLGSYPKELLELSQRGWIHSNDSSSAFWQGYKERPFVHGFVRGGKDCSRVNFEVTTMSPRQKKLIIKNMEEIETWIK